MRGSLYGLMLVAFAPLAFGQLDSNSITVAASRSMSIEPDEAVFVLSVTSSQSTGLDQIVAAIGTTGITAANLVSVNTVTFPSFASPSVMGLQWSFVLAVPLTALKNTTASLGAVQQTIIQNGSDLTLTFQLQGTRVSAQTEQSQLCPFSDLLADAGQQAKKLADAALLSVGPILAISERRTAPDVPAAPEIVVPGIIGTGTGSGSGSFLLSVPLPLAVNSVLTCSLTVKFTLYRYH
jgi:hypothetical protein